MCLELLLDDIGWVYVGVPLEPTRSAYNGSEQGG